MRASRILVAAVILTMVATGLVWAQQSRSRDLGGMAIDLDVQVGEVVEFTITATNPGPDTMHLEFSSGQQFDIMVSRDGEKVWQWSDGLMFTEALVFIDVEPGDSLEYTAEWEPTGPGTYTVRAMVIAIGESTQTQEEFEIR